MFDAPIRSRHEVMEGDLLTPGRWIVANIGGTMAWTRTLQRVQFRGTELFILPVATDAFPSVAIRLTDDGAMTDEDARRLIMGFLSSLCWVERHGVLVQGWTGGALPHGMGGNPPNRSTRTEFDFSYLPEPDSEAAKLALALYREGHGLNHPAYAFLSFYRVLEIRFHKPEERRAWINGRLSRIKSIPAAEVLNRLRAEQADIGNYLYSSGRCAIAHAKRSPLVHPDDPSDAWRLSRELPLLIELAEHLIEDELGVQSFSTICREHLYELAGFKESLGHPLVSSIMAGTPPAEGALVEVPHMALRLRGKDRFAPLEHLMPQTLRLFDKTAEIVLAGAGGLVLVRLVLDFPAERLDFDIEQDLMIKDDGSVEAARAVAEVVHFRRDYYSNGCLEVWDTENGRLLGKKDAFVPVNVRVNRPGFDAEITRWKAEADGRGKPVC